MGTSPGADTPILSRAAVITVSYGSDEVLPGLLASVPGAAHETATDLVVVDNLPDDDAVAGIAERFGARYLRLDSNRGYGGAMNAGAAELRPDVEWVLIANPDVELGEGTIDTLVRLGRSDPSIGSLGPAILTSEGTVYPSARSVPSLRNGIGHALFANIWSTNPWTRAYRRDAGPLDRQRDAGWLSGSCVLVRRSAFEAIGGFDEGFFMYFEDVDLGQRLGRNGFRNVYVPSVAAIHSGAHATKAHSAAMLRAHHASAKRFVALRYGAPHLWPVRAILTVGLSVRSRVVARSAHQ